MCEQNRTCKTTSNKNNPQHTPETINTLSPPHSNTLLHISNHQRNKHGHFNQQSNITNPNSSQYGLHTTASLLCAGPL